MECAEVQPIEAPCEDTPENSDQKVDEESEVRSAEYAYVDREHFTSEVFKIEIGNIPRHFGFGECKKLLKKKLNLNPHKIKQIPNISKIYVTFKNVEDKEAALEKLDKYRYRGHTLEVKNAKPKADAMAMKRPGSQEQESLDREKKPKMNAEDAAPTLSPAETIRNSVTKWHNIPYEEQLSRKSSAMKAFLCNCRTRLGKIDLGHEIFVWIMRNRAELDGICCPLQPIIPSPVMTKYRNKSEFTIGLNTLGEKTIGYRLGKYRDQTCVVEDTSGIDILPDKMQAVASKFQEYIRASEKDTYDPQNYQGHWKQLTVRTTLNGEVLAIIIVTENKDTSEEDVLKEKESLKIFFLSDDCSGLVSTLLYQITPTHRASGQELQPPQVLFGSGNITEDLLGLKFRISPEAFFQCNTLAAEVLYSQIGKMLQPNFINNHGVNGQDTNTTSDADQPTTPESGSNQEVGKPDTDTTANSATEPESGGNVILFDVCCGTGTIGLTLASKVSHVVGVELCEQAVEDAKMNAELNGIENCEFHCGKAEELLPGLVKVHSSNPENEIVAIVDPPRPGLHNKVIQCLRKCTLIKKIIYVSCNPNSIFSNVVDLCRPASKRMPGVPFLPYCAQPMDLFPQTPHCELILYFKRSTGRKEEAKMKSGSAESSPPVDLAFGEAP